MRGWLLLQMLSLSSRKSPPEWALASNQTGSSKSHSGQIQHRNPYRSPWYICVPHIGQNLTSVDSAELCVSLVGDTLLSGISVSTQLRVLSNNCRPVTCILCFSGINLRENNILFSCFVNPIINSCSQPCPVKFFYIILISVTQY